MANNDIGDIGSQCGFLLIVQVTGKTFDINVWHGVLLIWDNQPTTLKKRQLSNNVVTA
jgi:hypothetical protein